MVEMPCTIREAEQGTIDRLITAQLPCLQLTSIVIISVNGNTYILTALKMYVFIQYNIHYEVMLVS